MIDFFIIVIIFVVLEGIMYLIDLPFKNRIKNSDSVELSLKTRKNLKITRIVSTILLITLLCVGIICICVENNTMEFLSKCLGLIIAYAITKGYKMLTGNIQTYSKERYLNKYKSNFVFYLRSFESDFYTKSNNAFGLESQLAKAIKKRGLEIAAIGMTKELDAPVGASRVYVSDKTWKVDVAEMMQNAKMIFILMSDRESCIWEISNGAGMLNKICFIIDNTDKYDNIRKSTSGTIHFPEIDVLLDKLDNKITKEVINEGESLVGFVMSGNELDVFDFCATDKPAKINKKIDEVKQKGRAFANM